MLLWGNRWRGHLQRRNHTNNKVWMFSPMENYKLLGFNPWHQVLASSLLNGLFSTWFSLSQRLGTLSEGNIIRKKCLVGMRSTGSLPDGDNHGSSNKSLTRQQHYLSSCLRKLYALFTPPETCTLRNGMHAQSPSSEEPLGGSWVHEQ